MDKRLVLDSSALVVTHERRGIWAGHLRRSIADWGLRLVESRSLDDLTQAVAGVAHPLVLIDLDRRPREQLDALLLLGTERRDALTLVLDPASVIPEPWRARELGATVLLRGFVPPPQVLQLLDRWRRVSEARRARSGWPRDDAQPRSLWQRLLGSRDASLFPITTPRDPVDLGPEDCPDVC